jgi:hypothetical protein
VWASEEAARRGCHALTQRIHGYVELALIPGEGSAIHTRGTRFDAETYDDAPDACWRTELREHELKHCLR